jgi:tRNA nucleotidyltransferase (CCA-adding enzyme)
MARSEKKEGKGYHGFTFFTGKTVSVSDDLSRRDVTINAMAKNVLTGKLVDPYNGKSDLRANRLKHVTEAFREDPLRVYRVARFAAKLNFNIASETMTLMASMKDELKDLKAERVWKELEKVLELSNLKTFFEILQQLNVLDIHFQELAALQVPDRHDGTAFNHTMTVLNYGNNSLERFGLLVHDFGKGRTPKEKHPTHHNHDQLGEAAVKEFCQKIKAPKHFETFGILCATEHMNLKLLPEMRPGKVVRLVTRNKKYLNELLMVTYLDSAYREGAQLDTENSKFQHIRHLVECAKSTETLITGKELIDEGIPSGKNLGDLLFQRRIKLFQKLINSKQIEG